MKIPKWKRWLSYLWEIPIESSYSEHSEDLYVVLRRGRLQLCTANAIYSYEDLYHNFTRAFDRLDIDKSKELEVLILGIGMGSVPMIMEQLGFEHCQFTGVEIDEEIIALLSTYALPKIHSRIEIIQTDALSFVEICENKFDLIVIDVFINDHIPDGIRTQEFLNHVQICLKNEGLVMMNHLSLTEKDREKGMDYFDKIFKLVFEQGDYIDVTGNWMFVNDTSRIQKQV